jgi:hypothetical protein
VNLSSDGGCPKFTFEDHFLDWYERWLDEVISGELITDDKPSWFGYSMGGTEEQLLQSYATASDLRRREDPLYGLLHKKKLTSQALDAIELIYDESEAPVKALIVQIFTKNDYNRAKPYLTELAERDLCKVFKYVFRYQKAHSSDWRALIEAKIHSITDSETFQFCTYLLLEMQFDYGELLISFTTREVEMKRTAYYSLGKLPNKEKYLEMFIRGLEEPNRNVLITVLQALAGIKDKRLLPLYQKMAEKYPTDEGYVRNNLRHRLKEFGVHLP